MDQRRSRSSHYKQNRSSAQATAYSNEFNRVMQSAYQELAKDLKRKNLTPCVVCSLRTKEIVHESGIVDIFFTCSVL